MFRRILKYKYIKDAGDTINNYDKLYRMDKYPNLPVFKLGMAFTAFTVSSLGLYWVFRHNINEHISTHGSKIAGNIVKSEEVKSSLKVVLEDPELLENVSQLSTKLVQKICDDSVTKEKVVVLLTELVSNQEIKEKVVVLLTELVSDQAIQDNLVTLAINFLNRQEIHDQLAELLVDLLGRQDVTDRINRLVDQTCSHEPNREKLAEMLKSVLSNEDTKTGLIKLLTSLIYGK